MSAQQTSATVAPAVGAKRAKPSRRPLIITLVLLSALVLLLPVVLGGYWMRVLTVVFIFAIMAESVNIIAGYAGYNALGNAVFFGIGAYIVGVTTTRLQVPFWAALLLAGIGCVIYSVVIGYPILRLSGRYFLMATLGLLEITREIVLNLDFTGGAQGVATPAMGVSPEFANRLFYYLALVVLATVVWVTWWIQRHNMGLALRAIKFDEEAARTMGINTTWYKTQAWAVSAFFTGLAGGIYAYFLAYIEPASVFEIATSVRMYIEHVFGGAGTVFGPVLGAFILELLSELVWARFTEIHYLILGTLVILITLFVPKGLISYIRKIPFDRFGAWVAGLFRRDPAGREGSED
jgi:branched-chain amino acid transport system permease protein